MTLDATALIILSLATYRLSYALALETLPFALGVKFRAWADKVSPRGKDTPDYAAQGSLYDMVSCPYCLSFWLSFLIVLVAWVYVPILVYIFAVAGGALALHRSGR